MLNLEKFEYPTEALARAAWVSNFGMDVASVGTMTVSLSSALPNVIADLETFIGTDPVYVFVNAQE